MTLTLRIRYILAILLVGVIASSSIWYLGYHEKGPIYSYNATRDHDDLLDLFELERFWLTSTPDYSPQFMLKYMTPNKDPKYRNALHISVMRIDGAFVGFTAYYMHNKDIGMILFLVTRPEFRGKGYGKDLIRHAIAELKKMGAQQVNLVTRTTNIPAQKVYTAVGFDEILRDEQGYVYYEYTK